MTILRGLDDDVVANGDFLSPARRDDCDPVGAKRSLLTAGAGGGDARMITDGGGAGLPDAIIVRRAIDGEDAPSRFFGVGVKVIFLGA